MQVVVCGLAGWRLASLLVIEDGPFDIFDRLRRAAGVPDGVGEIEGLLPGILTCVWCASVWTASAMWLAWHVHPAIPGVVAAWAIAVVAERQARP